MKWVSKDKKKKCSIKRFFNGFKYAISGIIATFKQEQNIIVHTIFAILAITLGILLKISMIEFSIISLALGINFAVDLINNAIETSIDMAMPSIHPLAKMSKDMGSGAVLLASLSSLAAFLLIYLPKVLTLFKK